MGYVLLLPGEDGWRLPADGEVDAARERYVGRYGESRVWVAPVEDLEGDFFDPADLPEGLTPLARAAVGDMIRGRYDVDRDEY
jgi:hypothetical protein